jgi:hypothetical protein
VWRWFICLFQNVGNVEYGKKDVKVRQMSESGKVEKWNGGKVERCLTLCGNSLLSSEERGCECEVGRGEVRVGEGR